MNFVLLDGLKFKQYHFCGEILDLEEEVVTSPNTLKIAYFVIRFFTDFSFTWRQTLTRPQT